MKANSFPCFSCFWIFSLNKNASHRAFNPKNTGRLGNHTWPIGFRLTMTRQVQKVGKEGGPIGRRPRADWGMAGGLPVDSGWKATGDPRGKKMQKHASGKSMSLKRELLLEGPDMTKVYFTLHFDHSKHQKQHRSSFQHAWFWHFAR